MAGVGGREAQEGADNVYIWLLCFVVQQHKSRLRIKGQGRRGRVTCLHASSSQILLPRDWGLFGEYLGLLLTWPPSLSGQHLAFMSLVLFI